MSTPSSRPVPYAREMLATLAQIAPQDAPEMTAEGLVAERAAMDQWFPSFEAAIGDHPIDFAEYAVPGPQGAPDVIVSVLSPRGLKERIAAGAAPVGAMYNIHGGGMMVGNRRMDVPRLVDLVLEFGIVAATVEYRLAPEHPDPAPVEDCHTGLVWMSASAEMLGIDPKRIVIMGGSAGGGLSAGVSLIARDRGTVKLAGQMLLCPMIDDTNTTPSSHHYLRGNTWTRQRNLLGWQSLLGDRVGTDAVSIYAAPYRATDLTNLPPAFIEAGSAEMFRDENVEYANRIWASGGTAELHIWSGGFHGFDFFAPETELARAALDARRSWLKRIWAQQA
ncbi:alpha/beta hydrolase fold domain-containing protein [Devosia sp.]|uniref:alpha/beta hydrolase n=1 Tax=Devosia sp. TaxID=1871048 RepID=UPI0025FF35BD|nr:alpha/beta hydrolase fold domain-containing protein [Devosia sp.]MCR6633756.1 alpha/beta hydrolase [Devosia sp.]